VGNGGNGIWGKHFFRDSWMVLEADLGGIILGVRRPACEAAGGAAGPSRILVAAIGPTEQHGTPSPTRTPIGTFNSQFYYLVTAFPFHLFSFFS
jgi:hypothetical protein